ncbi:hypothetical protein HX875_12870 [Pseudomonas yamanorum]|jgi:hypothetical protein|uniref:Uncharacterized protein n=1 Tax=Pseudomonas yamanorum TaxID=515393 RepID=A0A7Y8EG00_9PSED|nr:MULTISPECIES: hypothetical protein [Pseudomonas]MCS3416686.1 hypothetical protein [Pseudomonas sp. BIGb0558]MCS3435954.1 hypothetical protein [Pseudomonas sp. BIGb0450]NVZ82362.1 hypothetical protein [Pseudomonas yamanorum]NWE13882.1 hypothetical protein [Pseudomonas yamanorum]NWE40365.1 hypothetical protein [Pseudomonas yamanorum]
MRLLKSLFFSHTSHRHFALLDAQGCCQAFKQCSLPPVGEGWVEVEEPRLSWMHRPLPASARVSPAVSQAQPRHALAS